MTGPSIKTIEMGAGFDQESASWDRLRAQLASVKPPIETCATLPLTCYSDEKIFKYELESIFHRSWIGIGRTDQWQAPGHYTAIQVAGVPVIVLRDEAGELRAFANTCRHRGTMLLEGQGCTRAIICPFHNWTYGLDGRLHSAPKMQKAKNFDKDKLGLVPFRLESRDGFAFLCFDEGAPPLGEWLGDFSKLHAPWSLGNLVSSHRREFEVSCNWKSFLEVFNEYYHLPFVHPNSLNDLYEPPDGADETHACYTTQFGATEGTGGLIADKQDQSFSPIKSLAGRNLEGARYTWVYPNMTFAASAESLWMYEAYPIAPDRSRIRFTFCFPAETVARKDFESRTQHYYDRLSVGLEEDISMLERQQRGLSTPYGKQGRFCTELEPNVANFACWYAQNILTP